MSLDNRTILDFVRDSGQCHLQMHITNCKHNGSVQLMQTALLDIDVQLLKIYPNCDSWKLFRGNFLNATRRSNVLAIRPTVLYWVVC